MGRAGRYTLSFMAWVAAYAGWSTVIGLVIAAVTGDEPRSVSPATSALFNVIGPLVPTLVALWFNDWARDGFPTREQQRARRQAPETAAVREPEGEPAPEPEVAEPPLPAAAANPPVAAAPAPAMPPNEPSTPRVVPAHPLGVPAAPHGDDAAQSGAFPVAPLLRDRD